MKPFHFISLFLIMFIFLSSSIFTSQAQGIMMSNDFVDNFEEDWDIEEETAEISDPFESYNRAIFKFNDKIATYILDPLSKGYDFLVPKKVQSSINNLFSNARMPIRFFNNLFQLKFKAASGELGRFLINSSVGLGGFFDPARAVFKLESHDEDFGQTLGYYGMGAGPYIVWPLLGPSSGRDTIGFVGDVALNPLTWLSILDVEPEGAVTGVQALKRSNEYSYKVRDSYKDIIEVAIDPYISLQHAYIQNRKKKIGE